MITPRWIAALAPAEEDRILRRGARHPRGACHPRSVSSGVAALIDEVRSAGDRALREHARRFDHAVIEAIEVPATEWSRALDVLDGDLRVALETAARSIRRFHAPQRPRPLVLEPMPGLVLGRRPDPLRRVGVYAPGGRATYPSSVLMGVVPARVAGVAEVVVCSPPGPDGRPSGPVMAACAVAGADRLFAAGGAGAIAAMALGTETIPSVDRIVGPGNAWVTEAKRQLSAAVGMDTPAGPSELLVIADRTADPEAVVGEMLAQAEHDPDAAVLLVTTDEAVAAATASILAARAPREPRADIVMAALENAGALLIAAGLDEAMAFAARYAPEHLLLLVADPAAALDRVRCAGTVLLGPRSSVVFGDYSTGANHVLPTGGLARSYSGLAVDDFVRWTTWQHVGPDAAGELAAVAVRLADAEGLPAHAAAARRAAAGTGNAPPATARDVVLPRPPYRSLPLYDPARAPVELDLSANTNLWGTCPPALDALRSAGPLTGYPTPYADPLRAAIADAWSVDPSLVTTGCGSDDVIDSALRAFCEPGAVVGFPAPTFPMAPVFARMNDARPRPVPVGPDGALDDDALASLASADVVYLCRPNNPTGAVMSASRVLELLDRARGLVLVDEAYGEYAQESLLGAALASGRAIVLRTFSKVYGLAGMRVGYGLGPEPLIRVVERSRGPYKVGAQAERAAIVAIRDGRDWADDVVRRTTRNREALACALRDRGLRVVDSRANFLLMTPTDAHRDAGVDAGRPGPTRQRGWAAAIRAALLERGIGVRAFPALDGVGEAIRVTVGPAPLMERFLVTLDEAIRLVQEGA